MSVATRSHLLPEVQKFLSKSPLKGMIGGREMPSSNAELFATCDPGSCELLAEVYAMQPQDVDLAVTAAADAFTSSGWAKLSPNDRGFFLHRLADAVENRKKIIAQIEAADCGKIITQAEADVQNFVDVTRYFADLAIHMQQRIALPVAHHEAWTVRKPWGPCGFIFPWNFPFLLVGWGIAPALAAGNTVVIKPAEDAPLSTIYLGLLAKEIGMPAGVINVVPGLGSVAGAALASHPGIERMSFTGSPDVGRLVAESCGKNLIPVKLELGGKGAAVVFDDVNIPQTAEKLVQAITFHAGQVCCDATRWLVQESVRDSFIDACLMRMKQVSIGYELDRSSEMGPIINEKQKNRVLGYIERGLAEGAEALLKGGEASVSEKTGYYLKPALLTGSLDNVAAREEIFGPVAYLDTFKDESEAVAKANDTDYGLANSVWTNDLRRAHRVAEAMVAGNSWINAHNVIPIGVPYAGIKKSGLGGGVSSVETLLDYRRNLSVVRPLL